MRFFTILLLWCAWLASLSAVCATDEPAAQTEPAATRPIVIKGATILTMTHGTIANGTVVIENGKIAEVGTAVRVPANAEVINAAGEYVLPGLVDPH
ncbi:MAG TPA: hypothetical protein VGR48_16865 [Terriglobales bacterium]|nr:hypothetical protein [Terriglobales bacterium]